MTKPMKRTTVNLTAQQAKQLHRIVKATGLKASEHIRRAVDQYVVELRVQAEQSVPKGR